MSLFQRTSMDQTWAEKLAVNDNIHCPSPNHTQIAKAFLLGARLLRRAVSNPAGRNGVYLSSTARANTPMFFLCAVVIGEDYFPSVYMEEMEDRRGAHSAATGRC